MAVGGLVKLKAGEGGSYRTKWPTCRVEWGENQPEMRSQGQIELSTISNGSTSCSSSIKPAGIPAKHWWCPKASIYSFCRPIHQNCSPVSACGRSPTKVLPTSHSRPSMISRPHSSSAVSCCRTNRRSSARTPTFIGGLLPTQNISDPPDLI